MSAEKDEMSNANQSASLRNSRPIKRGAIISYDVQSYSEPALFLHKKIYQKISEGPLRQKFNPEQHVGGVFGQLEQLEPEQPALSAPLFSKLRINANSSVLS